MNAFQRVLGVALGLVLKKIDQFIPFFNGSEFPKSDIFYKMQHKCFTLSSVMSVRVSNVLGGVESDADYCFVAACWLVVPRYKYTYFRSDQEFIPNEYRFERFNSSALL